MKHAELTILIDHSLSQLAQYLQVPCTDSVAKSYWRAIADGLPPDADYLCADPMAVQVDWAHIYLLGNEHLNMRLKEMQQYRACLQPALDHYQIRLHQPAPLRWYFQLPKAPNVTFHEPDAVLGKSMVSFAPEGQERAFWLSLTNELQMLLKDCPINQARQARGEPTVDTLWLWGEGEQPSRFQPENWRQFYSDDALHNALAKVFGVSKIAPIFAPDGPGHYLLNAQKIGYLQIKQLKKKFSKVSLRFPDGTCYSLRFNFSSLLKKSLIRKRLCEI